MFAHIKNMLENFFKENLIKNSIICFGELVVDCFGNIEQGFVPKFGGAPGNTAIGLRRLGVENIFMHAMVGHDMFGDFLVERLIEEGVSVSGIGRHKNKKTTLAFVSLTDDGQRSFAFYDGAHSYIDESVINPEIFACAKIFHFGSLTQSTEIGFATTARAIDLARKNNLIISYDPNVREALWDDLNKLKQIILKTIDQINILKINEEEALFLTGESDPEKATEVLWKENLELLIVTLGGSGVFYKTKNETATIPTIKVDVVDTTGAGDAFNAGLLAQILKSNKPMKDIIKFASVFASLSTTKKGAVDALPSVAEVLPNL